ncbi:DUF805 domain-containing protein [Achromobacter insolitus]
MYWFLKCLRRWSDIKGRAGRPEFWWFLGISWLIGVIIKLLTNTMVDADTSRLVSGVVGLIFLLPTLSVGARRLNDAGISRWLVLIPFYNLYLCSRPGEKSPT